MAEGARGNGGTASTYLSGALRQRDELGAKEPAEHAKERRKIIKQRCVCVNHEYRHVREWASASPVDRLAVITEVCV
jgi:hypothetical protein